MPTFKIIIKKDYTEAEKMLSKHAFIIYKRIVDTLAYRPLIQYLSAKVMKEYSPVITDTYAVYSEYNPSIEVLEREKKQLEHFLFGDISKLEQGHFARKALSNRYVSKVYHKIKGFVQDQIQKRSVLTLLSAMSLFVSWEILK